MTPPKREYSKVKMKGQRNYMKTNGFEKNGQFIPYDAFFKNSFINADRYIAEIQNRAWSLYGYAKGRNLVNVFVTLTLPTEYHKTRGIYRNGKRIKTIKNKSFIDDDEHSPKAGSRELSKMLGKIWKDRVWSSIDKDDRVYFRVTEPHKNGTPHVHASIFIPADKVDDFVAMIERKFPAPQSKIETKINNPVNYLMKYVLKTLDDLRGNEDNISDLTLWYIYHGINRFYTSRTLVSLDIHRVLGGRYTLLELTKMYHDRELTVLIDPQTKKIMTVYDNNLEVYSASPINVDYESMKLSPKKMMKKIVRKNNIYTTPSVHDDKIVTPAYMKDYELYNYFKGLDVDDEDLSLLHFGITQNEVIKRGLMDEQIDIQSLNDFNDDFDVEAYEEYFNV